ncbi:pyridoxine/pyridoxamine 5-phosphate oxidase 2 isoform X1 [Prunus yedoensis var. nudiflora]|uniref:pyridoxal 5'-phosphate synthase n=1 Tax=Prunus yedoensis var. nudiflora TaxID=2094558 RepID=A0A314ZXI1_PRUYE|nr:pyridoxine/pyridoxamine 5-phosphate oxidase 2 isoform X1 [Prunus yedoensis var. nudiflora]
MGAVTAPAPWKQLLLNAMESNAHLRHTSYIQLATIACNGRPSNRTVVFRGFQEDSDKIQINTDGRSRKIEELRHCPFAEICWYFTDSWEQFRINGTVDIIDGSNPDPIKLQQREKSWASSSLKSRLQYLGPQPGLPNLSEEPPKEVSVDPSTGPVGAFCVLVLDPQQVDYLNLKSNQRLTFASTGSPNAEKCWTSERVNP